MTDEDIPVKTKTGKQDTPSLLMYERQLLNEQKWIENAINQIKSQRTALQVENMNIESILAKELAKHVNNTNNKDNPSIANDKNSIGQIVCSTEEMDSVKSSMNTKTLDLSIDQMLDDIIEDNACTEEKESDEEIEE